MAYLQSNIPYFKCWVRKEYTHNHEKYHGEFIHAMAVAVTTMPTRCLSFQIIFTGAEVDTDVENVHGGAMWARMPITGLIADSDYEGWPEPMPVWAAVYVFIVCIDLCPCKYNLKRQTTSGHRCNSHCHRMNKFAMILFMVVSVFFPYPTFKIRDV